MTTFAGAELGGSPDPGDDRMTLAVEVPQQPGQTLREVSSALVPLPPRVTEPGAEGGAWMLMAVPIAICLGLVLYVFFV